MSSVSASDRSDQTDQVRQAREDYQDKETELVKKHKKEVKRLEEEKNQEIENIKADYGREIQDLRNKTKNVLTEQDIKNQKKVEDLRAMYMDQIKKKASEQDQLRTSVNESHKGEIEKKDQIAQQQREVLSRNFQRELDDRDKNFKEYQTFAQKETRDAIDKNRNRIVESTKQEVGALTQSYDTERARLEGDISEQRKSYEIKLRDQERQHQSSEKRLSDNFTDQIMGERKMHDVVLDNKNAISQAERKDAESHFQQKISQKQDQMENSFQDLKDNINGRIDRDVRSRDNKIQNLKESQIAETLTEQRLRNLERKNLMRDFKDQEAILEVQRDEAQNIASERAHKMIGENDRNNNKIMADMTRRNQSKIDMMELQNKDDRANLEFIHKTAMGHTQEQADKRVRDSLKNAAVTQENLQKYHEDQLDLTRNDFQQILNDQRQSAIEEMRKANLRTEARLNETENKYSKKLEEQAAQYESKIKQLVDNHKKEMKQQDVSFGQRIDEREKAHKLDMDTSEVKYQSRVASMNEEHQKEIERLNKRHQEELNNLISRMNYYQKNSKT